MASLSRSMILNFKSIVNSPKIPQTEGGKKKKVDIDIVLLLFSLFGLCFCHICPYKSSFACEKCKYLNGYIHLVTQNYMHHFLYKVFAKCSFQMHWV